MARVAARSIRDRVAEGIGSDQRSAFLSKLAWDLVLAARDCYPGHDTKAYRDLEDYVCLNEVLHNLTSQRRIDFGHGRGGYPDRALIEGIVSKSHSWQCETASEEALRMAIAQTGDGGQGTATDGPVALTQAAIALLASNRRQEFLADWFVQLASATRSIRPPDAPELVTIVATVACLNELLELVANALRAYVKGRDSEQDAARFADALIMVANAGRCGGCSALERALTVVVGAV